MSYVINGAVRDAGQTAEPLVVGALTAELPSAGGIQRYTGEVLRELLSLDHGAIAVVASTRVAEAHHGRALVARPEVMVRGSFAGNLLRLGWHQTVLPKLLRRSRAAAFYSTFADGMFSPPCPQVVTIHDLIPLRFPASNPRLQHYFRLVLPRLVRASDAVITMSEASRADVVRFYGVAGDRVHVVHQGYRADLFGVAPEEAVERVRSGYGLQKYVLSMAEGRPYKNIPRLLEAFARLRLPDIELVLVGRPGRRHVDLPALAASLGIAHRVRFLGFVPDQDLALLYAGAEAFVFPSLYEGFGIPPLEAMACGCAVVCSDQASLPEVCGDAARYVDPYDVDSIAQGIARVVEDEGLRARLRRQGLERSGRFSYRTAAERIAEVVNAAAGRVGA